MKNFLVILWFLFLIWLSYTLIGLHRESEILVVGIKKAEIKLKKVDSINNVIKGVDLIRTAISYEFGNAVDSFVVHSHDPYFAKRAEEAEIANKVTRIFCEKITSELIDSKCQIIKK